MSHVEALARDIRFLIIFSGIVILLHAVAGLFGYKMDDSDASAWNRSGLKPHTDHLTGCQYLQAPNGGLTQRLDASGGHICTTKGNT